MKKVATIFFLLFVLVGVPAFGTRAAVNKGGDTTDTTVGDTSTDSGTTTTTSQTNCSSVNQFNVDQCCNSITEPTNHLQCLGYQLGVNTTTTQTTTTTGSPTTSSGQTSTNSPNQCAGDIYSFNYQFCCVTFYSFNQVKCDAYNLNHPVPGTPGTAPVGSTGTQTQTGTTITATPQAGSADLNKCNNIRFLSLLDILIWIKCIIIVAIIPLIFAAALMFFLWGVMKFIAAADSKKKEEGKKFIVAGLIGLFVMTSLWGIIKIASSTLDTGSAVPLLQTSYLPVSQ